jgi:DNA-binding HxlR family transcriptional regulator
MVTDEAGKPLALSETQESMLRELLAQVAGTWPLWTLSVLADHGGPLRFARLLERLEGISRKMLTQTLRNLERDGLVSRAVFAEVPPRVEYALTDDGREMLTLLKPFWAWIASRLSSFEAARTRFDHARARLSSHG